jgi:hypothetical protein
MPTRHSRRVATPEISANSIVATRRGWLLNSIPALKRRAKLILTLRVEAIDQSFLWFVLLVFMSFEKRARFNDN